MEDFPFKTIFASEIKVLPNTEENLTEAKASLLELKKLLPEGINPQEEPDLLFIAANLAVAGLVNLNDDGIDRETAIQVYKKFEKKPVNIEHDRTKLVGYIIKAGLSELGTDRLITEEEALSSNKPFNIATVAVLWKIISKNLCDYIVQASNPISINHKSLSLSFEMGFKGFSIASIPKGEINIAKASKILNPGDDGFEKYFKSLKVNKGNGLSPDNSNERVYRIVPETVIPLGQGIVSVPAAAVKGIVAITEPIETEEFEVEEDSEAKLKEKNITEIRNKLNTLLDFAEQYTKSKTKVNNIISTNLSVSHIEKPINQFIMKQELTEFKEKLANAKTLEEFQTACASVDTLTKTLMDESEKLHKEVTEAKELAAKVEEAKKEAINAAEKAKQEAVEAQAALQKNLDSLKKELDEIKAAQAAAAAEEKFNQRMASLDETFELDAEDRALIIAEIKDLNDEAFAAYMTKAKKLMKEKTKEHKAKVKEDEEKKNKEMCAALKKKGIEIDTTKSEINWAEVIASAKENIVSDPLNNVVKTNVSLLEEAKAAFAETTIGGKKLNEITKKE